MTNLIGPENLEIFGQLVLAVLLGGAIGFERKLAKKTAGIRTFALVALGSALFVIIPNIVFSDIPEGASLDPSRMASQIVVGIGFLGAGLIVLQKDRVKGLTTAAGLWVSAAIGVAVGYKLYALASFATILTIIVLYILWFAESRLPHNLPRGHDEDD